MGSGGAGRASGVAAVEDLDLGALMERIDGFVKKAAVDLVKTMVPLIRGSVASTASPVVGETITVTVAVRAS